MELSRLEKSWSIGEFTLIIHGTDSLIETVTRILSESEMPVLLIRLVLGAGQSISDIVECYLEVLRRGLVPLIELVVWRTISIETDEYQNWSLQAVVAQTMKEAGVPLKPGETAENIITNASERKNPEKVQLFMLYRSEDGYDVKK